MNRLIYSTCVILTISLLAVGCDSVDQHEAGDLQADGTLSEQNTPYTTASTNCVEVANYRICLTSRTVSGSSGKEVTTFNYSVAGLGISPALSHVVMGINSCDPALRLVSYTRRGIVGTDPTTGVYGVKWEQSIATTGSANFQVTFGGIIPLGGTLVAVKAGDGFATGTVQGAGCKVQTYDVSGSVYGDANTNATFDLATEFGISNVTVELQDGSGATVAAVKTGANGAFLFDDVPVGTYTLSVPTATPAADFNETLSSSYNATTPTSLSINLAGDSSGNNFGFDIDAEQLTSDFETGALTSTAEDIKFWREQVNKALSGSGAQNSAVVKRAELEAYLLEIDDLFHEHPFVFAGTGTENLRLALKILSPPSNLNDPHLEFLAALLMAELNYVSGRDIIGSPGLLEGILAWAEARYVAEISTGKSFATYATSLTSATKLLNAYGGSGGVDN